MKHLKIFSKNRLYYKGPKSDHFDGKKFFNPWNPIFNTLLNALRWKMTSRPRPWPKKSLDQISDIPPQVIENDQLRVTFVGHSTLLIQTQGMNILTDPIWSKRAGPFKWLGPKRHHAPGIAFQDLPKIDAILISHSHYDHLDLQTIKKLWDRDQPQIIAPLGNDAIIQSKYPLIPVITLDWNQSVTLKNTITIHLEPSQHWSQRNFWDRNRSLWGAFVIETKGGNLYFSGDTGYAKGDLFRAALKKFDSFRFAMIPIGAYEPRWFMTYAHMNPEEAVCAYRDLGQPYTTAMHFQTFHLSDEGYDEPREKLVETCKKLKIDPQKFRALDIGEAWLIPK